MKRLAQCGDAAQSFGGWKVSRLANKIEGGWEKKEEEAICGPMVKWE
jgi:hypothetical protein